MDRRRREVAKDRERGICGVKGLGKNDLPEEGEADVDKQIRAAACDHEDADRWYY